jgi:hypothetical protein
MSAFTAIYSGQRTRRINILPLGEPKKRKIDFTVIGDSESSDIQFGSAAETVPDDSGVEDNLSRPRRIEVSG